MVDTQQQQQLPTVDELAGNSLPTVDELAGKAESKSYSGPISDYLYTHTPQGRLLSAFGQGYKEGFGSGPIISDDTTKWLQDHGVFNDYKSGNENILKSFNEAFLRGAATVALGPFRQLSGVVGGIESTVAQAGVEVGAPKLGQDAAGILEKEFTTGSPELLIPHIEAKVTSKENLPTPIVEARANDVIGGSEGSYFGTKPPTPAEEASRTEAIAQLPETKIPLPVNNIHDVARQFAPEVFQAYDEAQGYRQYYRNQIEDLQGSIPDNPRIQELQDQINKLEPFEKKGNLTNAQSDRLSQFREELDSTPKKIDTPEVAELRQKVLDADFKMRDLAPDVSTAYRLAQEHLGSEAVIRTPTESPLEAPQQVIPEETTPVPTKVEEPSQAPQEVLTKGTIQGLVSKQLQTAGRPPEEAQAVGKLVEEHYKARARRFGGKLGTAKELFDKEAPEVKSAGNFPGKERASKEYEQEGKVLNQAGLIVAKKNPDGTVSYGEPGQLHFDLYSPEDYLKGTDLTVEGFSTGKGEPFMDRKEALNWVSKNEPEIKKIFSEKKDTAQGRVVYQPTKDLESVVYREAARLASENPKGFIEKILDRFFQDRRGAISIRKGKNLIRLFKNADASTFLHETGHQWLEELFQDAQHPEASLELKADLDSVKGWLKFKEGQTEITRKQHEKFARGFERYLMEGIAPSKRLSDIFEKFKNWLTQIYKSVLDLKSPINDDIRQVFDRLVVGPQRIRTVIAEGEREVPLVDPSAPSVPDLGAVSKETQEAAIKAEPANNANPNQILPKQPTKYVDKAGNINLDNVTNDASLKDAIRDIVEANQEYITQRGGKISQQETIDVAASLAVSPSKSQKIMETITKISGDDPDFRLSASLHAIKILMKQSAEDVMKAVASNDPIAFSNASQKLNFYAEKFSGVSAETGRTLNILKRQAEGPIDEAALNDFLLSNVGKTFYQIQDEMKKVGALDSTNKVVGFVKEVQKPSLGEMIQEVFINKLISGPITHLTYTAGQEIFAASRILLEGTAQAGIAKLHELISPIKIGEELERTYAGEVLEGTYGLVSGHLDGIRAAWEAFKAGRTQLLPGEESAATYFTGKKAVPGMLGTVVRLPGERMVAPLHSFNRTVVYTSERNRLIYRQAKSEGLEGDQLRNRIAELKANTPERITKEAVKAASESALMGKPGAFTRKLSGIFHHEIDLPVLGRTQPLAFIAPFISVANNINRLALLERSPLGFFSRGVRDDIAGVNGRLAQDTAIAKMAAGTSIGIGIGTLYSMGYINGAAPQDYKEATIEQAVKGLPHSVRIGEMSYALDRLGIIGAIFSIGANAAELYSGLHKSWVDKNPGEAGEAGVEFLHGLYEHFTVEGFMSGISDIFKAMEDPDRYGENYAKNFVSTFLMGVGSQQIAQRIDPYKRDTSTWVNAIKAKTPFQSETLPSKIDLFGNPVPNKEYLVVYAQHLDNDPVYKEFKDAGFFPAPVKRQIMGVNLTPRQYHDYAVKAGMLAHQALTQLVNLPNFDDMPPKIRHDFMQKIISKSRSTAAQSVMLDSLHSDNDIVKKATDLKKDLTNVKGHE